MITPHSMANGNISASDNDNNEHTRQCYRTNENVHPSPPIALYSCSLSRRLCFLSVVGSRECEQRILLLDALFCTTEMHGEWKNVVCGSGEVRTGEQTRARSGISSSTQIHRELCARRKISTLPLDSLLGRRTFYECLRSSSRNSNSRAFVLFV